MKIAVIGAGGVGGFFGACLARAGHDVTFLARGEHLSTMQARGLIVRSIQGDFRVSPVRATDNIRDICSPDLVLVGVKAGQIKEIRAEVKDVLQADSIVLPLQNGVLAAAELTEAIPRSHVLGGLCRIISKIESPGVIRHFGAKPTIVLGELDHADSSRAQELKALFESAGIEAAVSHDIVSDLWKKFIFICTGGLMAVTRTSFGELRALPETRQLMLDLITEIYRVSRKAGANIDEQVVEKTMSLIDNLPADSSASLARDIWAGKPSELEYQNGTVVRLGEEYGIDTPVNRFVYHCLLPMELKARGTERNA